MSFLKSSFWASISTGVTMLCGLITTKYVAMVVGPSGMAYVGQFSNATSLITLFASGACLSGVVKYISEFQDIERRQRILANAIILIGSCVLITSLFVIISSKLLSKNAFNEIGFWNVFLVYGLLLIFPTFNALIISIFNGLQQLKLIALLNIINSCINVISIIILARIYGIKGVLLATTISAFFSFFIYFYLFWKNKLISTSRIFQLYHFSSIKLLLGYSAMNIVSGIIAPSLQLFVRTKLLHNYNADTAGLWQANTRLSDYYLNFVYNVIGMYYLPKLSETKDLVKLKREVRLGYLRILPAVILITSAIWICRSFIVRVFLTNKFMDMLILLKWQLIGDVIKISSWILGYIMVAKAMKKSFIVTELVFSVSFIAFNYLLINHYGLIGSVYAFALNYFIYLIVLIILLRKYIF